MDIMFWGVTSIITLYHLMNLWTNPNETFWHTIWHAGTWNKAKDCMVLDRKTYTYAKDKK